VAPQPGPARRRAGTGEVAALRPTTPLRGWSLFTFCALTLAGLLGNYFGAPLFLGLDFLFGSIFVLVAVQLFGLRWGTAAAVVAASYTWSLWGHPWAAVVLVAEAVFVGVVAPRLRHNLLLADGLFWALVGMPLVGLFYGVVMDTTPTATLLVALKQAVNGIFDALLASLLLTHTPLLAAAGASRRAVPLRQVVYELLVAAVLAPTLVLVMAGTRQDLRRLEEELFDRLDGTTARLAGRLASIRERQLDAVTSLARTGRVIGVAAGPELQRAVELIHQSFQEFETVAVADADGRPIAVHPPETAGDEPLASVSLADRPFVTEVRRTRVPAVSDVLRGRGPTAEPVIVVAAPVIRFDQIRGFAIGSVDLQSVAEVLRLYAPSVDARITLVDRRGVVIASTVPGLVPLTPYAPEGELRALPGGQFHRVPELEGQAAISRWGSSSFGREVRIGASPVWHLTVELPVAPLQDFLQRRYLQGFGVIFGVCLLALLFGAAVSAWLARPLAKLAEATTGLPERLESGELPAWPRSRVVEFDSLSRNFRSTAQALEARFLEVMTASSALAERSAELESEVAERRRAESALRLLAEAGAALASSLEPRATLERIARSCVPGLANWAVVELAAEGESEHRIAVAHEKPDAEQQLRSLAEQAAGPLMLDGEKLEEPLQLGDPLDWTITRNDALGTLLREMGAAGALLVPLRARGRTLGTLALVRMPGQAATFEEQEVHLAEELARRAALALDNAQLYAELREADRRKDEFLAMLAHELRNPLSPLATSLGLLRSGAASPAIAERALSVMERQLGHIVRLVDDLLDVARITRGRIELHLEALDLTRVVAQTVENLRPRFQDRGQQLTLSLPDEPIALRADGTRLDQIVANLLANANKYTPPGGHVHVVVAREGDTGVVRISDDGIGMPPALLHRVFDLFMQSEQALDRSQGGLGIGLTLVRQLVERHGGTVVARSDGLGKGSEFEVRLPVAAEAAVPSVVDRTAPATAPTSRRVLVVDDNVEGAESLAELLRLWGHTVEVAHDGPSGIAMAERQRPEVVLLDIGLPGLDGYEVGRRLRAGAATRDTRIIAVTGYGEQVHGGRLEEIGFDKLLVKPVHPPELQRLLLLG
jgi:signal transduction histidine kinase/CheY-like chemotaxis protein